MRTIRVLEAAAEEAAEAAAWYEQERPGLGSKFQAAVDAVISWNRNWCLLQGSQVRLGNAERGVSC